MHPKTLAILALATTAVVSLTACGNETALYANGFDRSRGAAMVEGPDGEERVWTGMDQDTLCAVDLDTTDIVDDVTVYDSENPMDEVEVLDADPNAVLVVDGGDVAIVDPATMDSIPVVPGVEVEGDVADGNLDGEQITLVYDNCTVLVSDTQRMDLGVTSGCEDARILKNGDQIRIFVDGTVFAVGEQGAEKLQTADAYGMAPALGLWASATGAVVTAASRTGETVWTVELERDITDVFGFGDEIGVRYEDGRVITLDPTSGEPTGFDVFIATGGTLQGSNSGSTLVLEQDGMFVFKVR